MHNVFLDVEARVIEKVNLQRVYYVFLIVIMEHGTNLKKFIKKTTITCA